MSRAWSDLADLFPRDDRQFWFLLAAAVVLQAGYWYLATPGPRLLGLEPRLPEYAVRGVLWSLVWLMAAPMVLTMLLGYRPRNAGLRASDAGYGVIVTLLVWGLSAPFVFLAASDRSLQLVHPWPGAWAGNSVENLAIWAGIMLLHVVAFEYFFRGFLLGLVADRWGRVAGLWFQATAATLITLGAPLPQVLVALPAGLLLGVLALRSRSLLYPIALHWLVSLSADAFSLYHQNQLLP